MSPISVGNSSLLDVIDTVIIISYEECEFSVYFECKDLKQQKTRGILALPIHVDDRGIHFVHCFFNVLQLTAQAAHDDTNRLWSAIIK